jgi:hypothetical protein
VALASCANPVAPTGGPRDRTPPSIAKTRPVQDTVNVSTDTRSVYVEFSEYVERSTLPQALSVTPQFEGRFRFDWSGRGVSIELPTGLRDSTTYIFAFDTNLTDARGVSLDNPIRVAFATGPRINRGKIRGRVVGPRQGEPQPRVNVYAYGLPGRDAAPPSPLPEQPDYRTQTGEDGSFSFAYLKEQYYYVIALRDDNRNRRPDRAEPFAVPPYPAIPAPSDSAAVPVPWLLTRIDTLAPSVQQVRPLSRRRLQLSFSEPVRLASRTPGDWALRDSASGTPVAVRQAYIPPNRADAVVLRTAPMTPTRYALSLTPELVTDTLGQGVAADTVRFRAVDRADTTRTRFRGFVPAGVSPDTAGVHPLLPGLVPGVRFNQAPDSSTLRAALALRDTSGAPRPYRVTSTNGRTVRLRPRSPLRADRPVEVTVDGGRLAGPDSTYRRRFRRVSSRQLGALEGRVLLVDTTTARGNRSDAGRAGGPRGRPDTLAQPATNGQSDTTASPGDSLRAEGPVVVELRADRSSLPVDARRQTIAPGSTFVFEELPEGQFTFRAFLDRNENERWDGGQLAPYEPAEPLTWSAQPTDSRPRWTSVLSGPLRVPLWRPSAPLRPVDASGTAAAPDTAAVDTAVRDEAVPDSAALDSAALDVPRPDSAVVDSLGPNR